MLVQLMEHNVTAGGLMSGAESRSRGFQISADTMNSHWQTKLNSLVHELNRNPTEETVGEMAKLAGEAKTTATCFRDYLNYRGEVIRHVGAMVQAEHRFYGSAAQVSAQVAKSQDQMVQLMGQAAYGMNISGKYTQGIMSGYQRGMSVANSIL